MSVVRREREQERVLTTSAVSLAAFSSAILASRSIRLSSFCASFSRLLISPLLSGSPFSLEQKKVNIESGANSARKGSPELYLRWSSRDGRLTGHSFHCCLADHFLGDVCDSHDFGLSVRGVNCAVLEHGG